uniref:CeLIM-7 (inferred by orthology to a C. elegans protein) n=1 Tax=Strongyloides venezuelensis TaxID=75913 RepID=A0A0K0G2B5_STRVS
MSMGSTATSTPASTATNTASFIIDSTSPSPSKYWNSSINTSSSTASNSSVGSCFEELSTNHRNNNYNTMDSNNNSNNNGVKVLPSGGIDTFSPFNDYQKMSLSPKGTSICNGCRHQINDRYVLRVNPNLEYHESCLKCTHCSCSLDETTNAFVRNSNIYCRDDYFRLFGVKCARCDGPFLRNDYALKSASNTMYHMDCFSCNTCSKKLHSGDQYLLRDNELYCRLECAEASSCHMNNPSSVGTTTGGGDLLSKMDDDDTWEDRISLNNLDHITSMSTPPLSIKSSNSEDSIATTHHPRGCSSLDNGILNGSVSSTSSNNGCGSSKKGKKDKQTTRVRTVLNETQLRTLKACYASNSRPDAILKEQLVEMTGLSARVIRVWFQNKRCKDKKRQVALTAMQQAAEKERALNGVRLSGVGPLVTPSPTTHHDPNLQGITPIDIRQYPGNCWEGPGIPIQPPPPYHSTPQMMGNHMHPYTNDQQQQQQMMSMNGGGPPGCDMGTFQMMHQENDYNNRLGILGIGNDISSSSLND